LPSADIQVAVNTEISTAQQVFEIQMFAVVD
jgi:hypothetical protein